MCDSEMVKKSHHNYGCHYGVVNSNIHYECPKCSTTCVEHIRLGQKYREIWRYKNVEWEREL